MLNQLEKKAGTIYRHKTHEVVVGAVKIGGDNPIVVQSMALGSAENRAENSKEILDLARAGSELIRIAINSDEAMKSIPYFQEQLLQNGFGEKMLIGCGQYELERLLYQYPEHGCLLAKIRINPGNVGFGDQRDSKFERVIEYAIKHQIPIRIGVNWGSLDKYLSAKLMDENAASPNPQAPNMVLRKALVLSALLSARRAEELGMPANMIVVSCKTSNVTDLISVYTELAKKSNYALHLGLTEGGMGMRAIVNITAGLSNLLLQGIGDTIRASLTQQPGESRVQEVQICQEILQSLGFRCFMPQITSCPGCGRTAGHQFQKIAFEVENFVQSKMADWKLKYRGVEALKVAVMGCIVNGPGESRHANIGISLPGRGERPVAVVYTDGVKFTTLHGDSILSDFIEIIDNYVVNHYCN